MARIKLITLAVLAVFCVGVVASATAFADEGLEFVNKNGAGNKLVKNKFSSTGGEAHLFSKDGIVVCLKSTDHGVITSTTGGEATILFKECSTEVLGKKVACTGGKDAEGSAKEGEILTLVGILTTPSNEGKERLLLLTIFTPGTLTAGITSFECGGVKIEVRGSLLTSNNYKLKALSKEYTLEFKVNTANKEIQSVTESENAKKRKNQMQRPRIEHRGSRLRTSW